MNGKGSVRCTCIGQLVPDIITGRPVWRSEVVDPECKKHSKLSEEIS